MPHPILTVKDRRRWGRLVARDFQKYLELDPASLDEVILAHPDRYQRATAAAVATFLNCLQKSAGEPEDTRFSAPVNTLKDLRPK